MTDVSISIGWILATIGALASVIAALASMIYQIMQSRLNAQDKIIDHLKEDVGRMSKGCGADSCHWSKR